MKRQISIGFEKDQEDLIRAAAKEAGLTFSDYVRHKALVGAKADISGVGGERPLTWSDYGNYGWKGDSNV